MVLPQILAGSIFVVLLAVWVLSSIQVFEFLYVRLSGMRHRAGLNSAARPSLNVLFELAIDLLSQYLFLNDCSNVKGRDVTEELYV